ncbi:mechanosensitive ion channel family protein [Bacillus taeanensis]|uniref:Mechanosensitive ion channel family protein n=2 Tax=Bacillus taeanensis TaxID=273032 RepID=A0A366Y2E0_9BACI|nr:mechanosensitive ion channel family protein [Bacillus taeanensis]
MKTTKRNERLQQKIAPFILSFINWLSIYAVLLFILIYFADSKWMFSSIFSLGKVEVSLFLIIIAVLIISFAHRASKLATKTLLPTIYERYSLDSGLRFTFDRFFYYGIMVFAVIISLNTVGIDLSVLTVFAGVIGVGIGFGMQNIASNFISGLIILFERPIKVGDRIIINDIVGDVEKINMRATVVKTLNNEHIIIPNSYFLEDNVVNHSYGDPRIRLVIPIGVAYGSGVEFVKSLLEKAAEDEAKESKVILSQPKPFVNFVGFGDSSLDFELFIWISNPKHAVITRSSMNFRINRAFNEYKIEIPFPQRDLHVRTVDEEIIKQLSTASKPTKSEKN